MAVMMRGGAFKPVTLQELTLIDSEASTNLELKKKQTIRQAAAIKALLKD